MPMTRSQARLTNTPAKGYSIPDTIPDTVATERLFADNSTTDEINWNSSLFNKQASTAGPRIFRMTDGPSDDRHDNLALPSSWMPSADKPSHKKWSYPLIKEEDIPCVAPEDVQKSPLMKRPAILAMGENAKYLLGLDAHAPATKERTPLASFASPQGPSMPTLFGSRSVQNWRWPSFLTNKPPQPCPSVLDISQKADKDSQEEYEQGLQMRAAKVEKILEKVNCLADLTEKVVRELIDTDYGLLTIQKFKVTLIEWDEWSAPMKAKGLPVDLNNDGWEHITIQCGDGLRKAGDAAPFAEALAAFGIFPPPRTKGWGPNPEQGDFPFL